MSNVSEQQPAFGNIEAGLVIAANIGMIAALFWSLTFVLYGEFPVGFTSLAIAVGLFVSTNLVRDGSPRAAKHVFFLTSSLGLMMMSILLPTASVVSWFQICTAVSAATLFGSYSERKFAKIYIGIAAFGLVLPYATHPFLPEDFAAVSAEFATAYIQPFVGVVIFITLMLLAYH